MSSIARGGVHMMEAELAEVAERFTRHSTMNSHRTGCAIIAAGAALASAHFASSEKGAKYALPALLASAVFGGWFVASALSGTESD